MNMENQVKVWHVPDMFDATMLKASYVDHAYPWHAHEEFSLGLVVEGAINLRTRSRQGVAKVGSFVLVNSEEAHQGTPAVTGGWRCRTMHIHPSAIKQIAADIKPFGTVRDVVFPSPTIEDIQLTQELLYLHRRSEMANSPLERQSRIVALIGHLCERYAGINQNASEARSREFHLVRRARDYLQENLAFKVTLDELSNVASLPPFRLLRAFQLTFGLTPHAYQTQARVRAAYAMLRLQTNIADIAAQTGFADQAHLTRVFKSLMGATPGQYRTALAAARPNARL
jgi:AraC-like DNA-binding protein